MLKLLSSVRITVVCLLLLFILTFWGTVAQVQQGLYVAQERFFTSFFFLAGGWFPFPGAQLVLWVLFINLVAALIVHFAKHPEWTSLGSKIVHVGLLLYFVAAFFIFHLAQESYVHLGTGESTNVSISYNNWELAYWQKDNEPKAIASDHFKPGQGISINDLDFTLSVEQYYPNADAYNRGGNLSLQPKAIDKEREKNFPGGIFNLNSNGQSHRLVLSGADSDPRSVDINSHRYYFILRHQNYPLPFTIRLDHFKAEFHPGTQVAKSFESLVTISTASLTRQVRIYMNNPLRYKDYTLYQASYDVDTQGHEYSTLAVVKNSAKILPYLACFSVFFGLALHFLIQAFAAKRRNEN
jgi:hypothetical protein